MRSLLRIGATLALAAALLTATSEEEASATFIGDNGRIFYSTWGAGKGFSIRSIEPDGTDMRRLTRGWGVTVSPDGARIAFIDRPADGDDTELYVAWADGTHRRRVTDDLVDQRVPSFDSRAVAEGRPYRFRVVFVADRDLFSIDPLTGIGERLTRLGDLEDLPGSTDVAEGGILFLREEEGIADQAIWRVDRDGRNLRQLTDDDADHQPEFEPDSGGIWFARLQGVFDSNSELFTMNPSGGNQQDRSDTGEQDERWPAPSPDGTDLAYTQGPKDAPDGQRLYVRRDGRAGVELTGALDGDVSVADVEWQAQEPPDHEIASGPGALTNDATPSFTFRSDEVGTSFFCRLVGPGGVGPSLPCGRVGEDGEHVYTVAEPLTDGEYSLTVTSRDLSGAADPNPETVEFEIDTDPPETGFSSGPLDGATVDSDRVTFGFGATENGATLECRLDSAPFSTCVSPRTVGPLTDGTHRFAVRALDAAGNADLTPAVREFTVDTGADPDPDPPPTPTCRGRTATIVAEPGTRVTGTPGRDVIVGTPGRDVIGARGGADLVCAGGGRDVVRGAGGRDRVYGQGGADRLKGGSGADRLFGQGARDRLEGGPGNDRLVGGAKQDRCRGGKGRDRNRSC